jgi:PAS domain S-box-containing protein
LSTPETVPQRQSASSASLVGILADLPAIVWEAYGLTYDMSFVSPRARDILGHDPATWVEEPGFWEDHLHPDDRDRTIAASDAALAARSLGTLEYRFRAADGTYRWFQDRFRAIEEEAGGVRLAGVMFDVTDEHDAREAQLAAEAERDRLIQAVEQAVESIYITDTDGRIVYANAGFERATGYGRGELAGRTAAMLQADPQESAYIRMWAALQARGRWSGELLARRKDGTTYREASSIAAVRDATGTVVSFVSTGRDVTRERELEGQLAKSARLEAIGQLAGGVAHEFNNLLTAILGYGSLLAGGLPAGGAEAADLDEMLAAARRAQALTSQLLAFGRRSLLQPRVVDPAELVAGLCPMLDRLIGDDIALEVHADAGFRVLVDPGQLEQVVVNLVVNARDAMSDGGTVTISVHGIVLEDRDGPGRPWVVVEVADTGSGMTADVLDHVFEPFFTTKPVGRGTGLGLAMVDGFMRASGGEVRVASTPGAGTRMALLLPETDEILADAAPSVPEPAPSAAARPLTVLVVEDEPVIRRLAARTLVAAGHRVLEAADGDAALDVAARCAIPIDVLFTDVVMPGLSGPALAIRLRASYP